MKRKLIWISLFSFLAFSWLLFSQVPYPFSGTEGNRDILAYWYNVPSEQNVNMGRGSAYFQSSLHIYGRIPGDSFKVSVQVFLKNNKKVFENSFDLKKSVQSEAVRYHGDYFRLRHPVEYLPENPDRIVVIIESADHKRSRDIKCRYHKLSGKVAGYDGKPLKAHIGVCPDAFFEFLGKYTDEKGNYEIELPERTYNAVIANTGQYGISLLESWAWHMIIDSNQTLNFKIGNGEVYNLNAWTTNGGDWTYFLSFRPMVLEWVFGQSKSPIQINDKEFFLKEAAPELEAADIKVTVNGKELPIISVQKYYETGLSNEVLVNYVVQVDRRGVERIEKQNFILEYRKEAEWQGKKLVCYSMGQFQAYLNFNGLSPIF